MSEKPYVRITCCGDCIHYNWKKHKCSAGGKEEGAATFPFYTDCPLGIHYDSRWIPCSEKLPEEAGEYLVTYHPCYWDDVEWEKRNVGLDTFRGKTQWAKRKYQRVIAWMRLPDRYRGEEKNDTGRETTGDNGAL